ncbi:MAG: histidine kinase [Solobacterium sp.]|nr:histidine kinase [Solobacterium sp.]
MTDWLTLFNFSANITAILISIINLSVCLISRNIDDKSRRFFSIFFIFLTLYSLFSLISQISMVYFGSDELTRFSVFMFSLMSSMLMPMLVIYLLNQCNEDWKTSPLFRTTIILWFIYVLLLVFAQFNSYIYTVSSDNVYSRGPLYPVLLVPPVLIMFISLIALFHRRDRLDRHQFYAFLFYFLLPMLSMIIQMTFYGVPVIVIGTTLGAAILFFSNLSYQINETIRQKEENVRLQTNALMLQMRPHFIYNVMTSIYYLIQQDPQKAQQVVLDFTTYLRKNFTAMGREEPILFTAELKHTRAYLAVEQIRFENRLFVNFETVHTSFHIPPLTLQPVVENAVKHGLDPELEPLHLSVVTRKTDTGSEIIVEDNGPGFDNTPNDEPHVALENISRRLASMCQGTLDIDSVKGRGTKVRIFIPDPAKQERTGTAQS